MTPRKKTPKPESAPVEHVVAAIPDAEEPSSEVLVVQAEDTTCEMPSSDMALDEEAPPTVQQIQQMVAFHLGGQRYALPIAGVQEIQQIVALSEAHGGSSAVIGMVNLRGNVIPAIDIRLLLGLEKLEYRLDTPMIICRVADSFVALVVDDVDDVLDVPSGCLASPPKLHALADRMIGVCHLDTELVFLLSVEKLIAPLGLDTGMGWRV